MRIAVKQPEPPVRKEILAEAIVRIGDGFRALEASGLNRKAVVVLLHDATGIGKRDIEAVLNGLARLRGWYCRN